MICVFFDAATGEIKKTMTGSPELWELNRGPGETIMEVSVPVRSDTHCIIGGQLAQMPPKPSPNHVFNWTTKAWEDPRTLQELKDAASRSVNAARVQANFSTFTYAGKTFACDAASRADIDTVNGYVTLFAALPPGFSGAWKAVDNSDVPIPTVAVWKLFYAALVVQGMDNFAKAQAFKDKIGKAVTPQEADGTGW